MALLIKGIDRRFLDTSKDATGLGVFAAYQSDRLLEDSISPLVEPVPPRVWRRHYNNMGRSIDAVYKDYRTLLAATTSLSSLDHVQAFLDGALKLAKTVVDTIYDDSDRPAGVAKEAYAVERDAGLLLRLLETQYEQPAKDVFPAPISMLFDTQRGGYAAARRAARLPPAQLSPTGILEVLHAGASTVVRTLAPQALKQLRYDTAASFSTNVERFISLALRSAATLGDLQKQALAFIQQASPAMLSYLKQEIEDFRFREGGTPLWITTLHRAEEFCLNRFHGQLPPPGPTQEGRTAARVQHVKPAQSFTEKASGKAASGKPVTRPWRCNLLCFKCGADHIVRVCPTPEEHHFPVLKQESLRKLFAEARVDATKNEEFNSLRVPRTNFTFPGAQEELLKAANLSRPRPFRPAGTDNVG